MGPLLEAYQKDPVDLVDTLGFPALASRPREAASLSSGFGGDPKPPIASGRFRQPAASWRGMVQLGNGQNGRLPPSFLPILVKELRLAH